MTAADERTALWAATVKQLEAENARLRAILGQVIDAYDRDAGEATLATLGAEAKETLE